MKNLFRYIRYRICRNIYYADQCPMENRKNYGEIAKLIACAFGLCVAGLLMMLVCVLMAV